MVRHQPGMAPKVGGAKLSDGTQQKADGQLCRHTFAIVRRRRGRCFGSRRGHAGQGSCRGRMGHERLWPISKAIGSSDAASKPLLDKAGVAPDDGITGLDAAFVTAAKRRFYDREPSLRTSPRLCHSVSAATVGKAAGTLVFSRRARTQTIRMSGSSRPDPCCGRFTTSSTLATSSILRLCSALLRTPCAFAANVRFQIATKYGE